MAIKKYTNGSWVSASYHKYGTETDTIATLPVTIIGDGTPITSYTIKGNTEQSDTPTPSSPIYPSECGERTENLFDKNNQTVNKYVTSTGILGDSGNHNVSDYIEINPSTYYTLSNAQVIDAESVICNAFYDSNKTFLSVFKNTNNPTTIMSPSNAKYIRITIRKTLQDIIMLTEGSTVPTSYIPYGYKLPLTLGSTTINIYLGEVQSTRRIKKLVLTGEEDWSLENSDNFYAPSVIAGAMVGTTVVCSHQVSVHEYYMVGVENVWISMTGRLNFTTTAISHTASDFKAFLAQQYANGTPVTVWYVLAEPTSGIVNEPIRKIGTYTDSVSGTNLATSGTAQELNIETTLKPSEADLTYHGWHEHEDTKYST